MKPNYITPEMARLMEQKMQDFFAHYWETHATQEQKDKAKAEGKTFEGAAAFVKSVAKSRAKNGTGCVVLPDDCAYILLMEYMENQPEGATYNDPEAKNRRAEPPPPAHVVASRKRIAKKLEEASKQMTLF